jgi:hypothetical protein
MQKLFVGNAVHGVPNSQTNKTIMIIVGCEIAVTT